MEGDCCSSDKKQSSCAYGRRWIVLVLLACAVSAAVYMKHRDTPPPTAPQAVTRPGNATATPATKQSLPRLVDLGATKCIPCKMMAPILEELKVSHASVFETVFIDVWENEAEATRFGVETIPCQVFLDASGKELFRHDGFFAKEDILAKWKELGVELPPVAAMAAVEPSFSRLEPAVPDSRSRESVCYMCDGDANSKTRVLVKTAKGDVVFCSPHCYFIMCSSMVPPKSTHDDASLTDWASGAMIPAAAASYVHATDAANRPVIKAFADPAVATAEQQANGGSVVAMATLQEREMATRCGFCDRAVYPVDACAVKVEGLNTWGCCTMCALGVAARMQKDIEIAAKDALTGESIQVRTAAGQVASLDPKTAVAWAGTKKDAEGKLVSTGCFKQAFFVNEDNLRKWVEAHPTATGRAISISQALAEKMKLTAEQIGKACKIGECAPK